MLSYVLLAGLGCLVYVRLAYAETATPGLSGGWSAFLSNLLAAAFLLGAYRILRRAFRERISERPLRLTAAPSQTRRRDSSRGVSQKGERSGL